jgi:Ca-activated chloride channel family protein
MFRGAGANRGRLLVITDEILDRASALTALAGLDCEVSVLGVGTAEGGPVVLDGGATLKDAAGAMVIPRFDAGALNDFAVQAGGRFARLTAGDEDIRHLLADAPNLDLADYRTVDREFDAWREEGPWLLLLLTPLAALAFRRGWLWCLLPALLATPAPVSAEPWRDTAADLWESLWQTPDQRGSAALSTGDPERAVELFEDPAWKGSALYRAGRYGEASDAFSAGEDPQAAYNLGNALARQGRLQEALAAYDRALARDPDDRDAQFNRDLVQRLMEQQRQDPAARPRDSGNAQPSGQTQHSPEDAQPQDSGGSRSSGSGDDGSANPATDEPPPQAGPGEPPAPDPVPQTPSPAPGETTADPTGEPGEPQPPDAAQGDPAESRAQEEAAQSVEQWLRRIPDDPGGLLRRKFRIQAEQRERSRDEGDRQW